ncbi:uncharacterized protein BDZ83DRAFT_180916 [Colletotrichum acutatum]|uniref:Uncharacterized protein n=1 Tax=Glomerella acutata TaxID=27357 RepID=A0AAD8XH94_GLOAC|nr:uncharacterized protein BDZ83DRAFT_180916 [Colletotrichum acutatum]KAK1727904.1 hypothetical protein BDZ83DRAFT_180916 [Colletotrichum acutatum]
MLCLVQLLVIVVRSSPMTDDQGPSILGCWILDAGSGSPDLWGVSNLSRSGDSLVRLGGVRLRALVALLGINKLGSSACNYLFSSTSCAKRMSLRLCLLFLLLLPQLVSAVVCHCHVIAMNRLSWLILFEGSWETPKYEVTQLPKVQRSSPLTDRGARQSAERILITKRPKMLPTVTTSFPVFVLVMMVGGSRPWWCWCGKTAASSKVGGFRRKQNSRTKRRRVKFRSSRDETRRQRAKRRLARKPILLFLVPSSAFLSFPSSLFLVSRGGFSFSSASVA